MKTFPGGNTAARHLIKGGKHPNDDWQSGEGEEKWGIY